MMNGNNNIHNSVVSPLVTAQERKRKILERRRREQRQSGQQKQQSEQLQQAEEEEQQQQDGRTLSSSSSSQIAIDFDCTSSTTDASSLFTSNNETNRFSAFGSLQFNNKKRRRRRSDWTTTIRSSSSNNDATAATGNTVRSTLFGAVMERTSSSPPSSMSTPTRAPVRTTNTNNDDNNVAAAAAATTATTSTSTPLATNNNNNNSRISWKEMLAPTTPSSSSSSRSKSFLTANSPCGFALLKVLESVTSPFRHRDSTTNVENDNDQQQQHHEQETTTTSPGDAEADDRRIEEWQEGFLSQNGNCIGVVDWSIKRKLRLECHPASCLPTTNDWQSAMTYWQHPAMYPLPSMFTQGSSSSSSGNNNNNTNENSTLLSSSSQSTREVSSSTNSKIYPISSSQYLSDMVRGREALLHRLVVGRPQDTSSNLWKQRRNREWQEAFRSLYLKWIGQVERIQRAWEKNGDGDGSGGGCGDGDVSAQAVTQVYFYAMTPGQTILFRIGSVMGKGDGSVQETNNHNDRPAVVPMVVLSSTNQSLRSKLRSMGVKLLYYRERSKEFEEASVERRQKPEAKATQDETDAVHQELEALRRAQAHGETAGADVSIASKTRTATQKSARSAPPLCLVGHEDCAAFFEFYLNTLGGRSTSWLNETNGDVPLLLSRNLGHYMHASLQSLAVASRRGTSRPQHSDDKSTDHHATIELRGTILPCAMGELVCAAASRMLEDTAEKGQRFSKAHDDGVGSHYFVVQAQSHDGMECQSGGSTTTGSASTDCFNCENGLFITPLAGDDEEVPSECDYGEVVNMVVWDVARPNMIAFKTEPRPNRDLH